MNPFQIAQTVLEVGAAVAQTVLGAIQAGDVSTLEALRAIVPEPAVLRAHALAVQEQQRAKAAAELEG